MDIDRDYQRELLQTLLQAYPRPYRMHDIEVQEGFSPERYATNMLYLEAHGLVDANVQMSVDGHISTSDPQLTHHGIDFLRDDGGLSAVLGVVTIKLHDDTLKSLIEAKIRQSNLSQPDKQRWIDQLRSLPAETTKHLALQLMDLGLAHAPAVLASIGTYLGIHT